MAKISDVNKILPATPGSPGTGGGGNFFHQANQLVNNIKEGMKMFRELEGLGQAAPREAPAPDRVIDVPPPKKLAAQVKDNPPPPPPPGGGFDLKKIIPVMVALGYGDKTVADVWTELSALTFNQVAELLKNVSTGK